MAKRAAFIGKKKWAEEEKDAHGGNRAKRRTPAQFCVLGCCVRKPGRMLACGTLIGWRGVVCLFVFGAGAPPTAQAQNREGGRRGATGVVVVGVVVVDSR